MIKKTIILLFTISCLYSCNSNNRNNKVVQENPLLEQADSITAQELVVKNLYACDYSDQNMEVSHYQNPVKLPTDEFKKLIDFFYKNTGDQITFEIVQLLNENELSEENFKYEMPSYAEQIYHKENGALLFIRTFTGAGNRLTVYSIHDNMIVSKIEGIILDADSDGGYYLSSKYKISESGKIEIDVTEEEAYLSETGINDFVIEYLEYRIYSYELSVNSNGIIEMNDKEENTSIRFSEHHEILESWSKEDLRKLRNFIFAKHSYIFKSQDLSEYFKQFDWYEAKYENVDDKLSAGEKKFVSLVKEIEDRK